MSKIKRIDIIAIVLFIPIWGFYFLYEGHSKLDINEVFTLPLLIALEYTAASVAYGIWRYNVLKGNRDFIKKAFESIIVSEDKDDKKEDRQ